MTERSTINSGPVKVASSSGRATMALGCRGLLHSSSSALAFLGWRALHGEGATTTNPPLTVFQRPHRLGRAAGRLTNAKTNSNAVSLAGEFAVLSQLAFRGYDANTTLGHTNTVDILDDPVGL